MTRVLKAAIADRVRNGKPHFDDLGPDQLAPIEKGKVLRVAAAAHCRALLTAARRDLAIDQMGPPLDLDGMRRQNLARSVRSIGITSAYRSNAEEDAIWRLDCFPQYYARTYNERMNAPGGVHGHRAVRIMVEYFTSRKAPPGFSNHSDGRAVDFKTTQGGVTYTADTLQKAGWRKTWLHAWLVEHATEHRFHPLASEEWHWEYR